jgi:hypothetical protein
MKDRQGRRSQSPDVGFILINTCVDEPVGDQNSLDISQMWRRRDCIKFKGKKLKFGNRPPPRLVQEIRRLGLVYL